MKSGQKKLKIGLIVGKFAPLHKGHQFLIEKALKKMDKVIVLVYRAPKNIKISLKKRVGWLRTLYPTIKVIEGRRAPTERGKDPSIAQKNIAYVKRVVREPITHVFSSEKYGELLSRALGAENVVVDEKREHFPVSGTAVRLKPKDYKKFLVPMVYEVIKKTSIDD
ncbi:MAG: adenylyltransferase/cytidyltransferase family protein [Candidatus Uhrbacteria bacterium]